MKQNSSLGERIGELSKIVEDLKTEVELLRGDISRLLELKSERREGLAGVIKRLLLRG